jgi:hypothetical protein
MIDSHHPRRKGHVVDTSMAGALIWLGVTLLAIAFLLRTVMDMRIS